jgi:hypothetical protein
VATLVNDRSPNIMRLIFMSTPFRGRGIRVVGTKVPRQDAILRFGWLAM